MIPSISSKRFASVKRAGMFAAACAACALHILIQDARGATPEVNIANGPLPAGRTKLLPNMVLSLSLEFPSSGMAYRGDNGNYSKMFEYIGYFNSLKCYVYRGGNRNISDGYFTVKEDADARTHECGGDSFSGNFMNWAASSTLDILRYALTGGDRIVDTADTSILQRAVLPENFYASDSYFPRRVVRAGGDTSAPNRVTPFNPATLYVVSCRNRILFSDSKSGDGHCDTPAFDKNGRLAKTDKKLGEYLFRVKVCDGAEGVTRTDLCQRYANYYKPVGAMQRHADHLRVAVMGYLLDDAATRYGGVLRAPMKYLGAKKFEAPDFAEVPNDKPEWDTATGVLYNNPDNALERNSRSINSGAINYLNKFGRAGIYKTLDPLGELYYEAVRYMQGKQPTPAASSGISEAMRDGFPVLETWGDPLIASCQKSYIVVLGDANTHWDRYLPGNHRTTYGNGLYAYDSARAVEAAVGGKTPELDILRWTRRVGEMEADAAGSYANPAPRANLRDLAARDTGADGHGTYYMAGLAYWANTNDIRLDKPSRLKTFALDMDEGGNGQIDGNPRMLKPRDSQLYLAAKYGGFDDKNNDGNPYLSYGADGKAGEAGSSSEWDGDGKGVAANYFLVGQPKEMIQSIRTIFSRVARTNGVLAGVSAAATRLASDGTFVYQAGFDAATWSGSLKKLKLTPDGASGTVQLASPAVWDAGERLTGSGGQAGVPAPAARNIYTAKINPDLSLSTVEFKWDKLSVEQKTALNIFPVNGKDDGRGAQRLDYLRGVRRLELGQAEGIFRQRERVLGDIINSNPTYVGAPARNVQEGGYQKFYDTHKDRSGAVYVGANDGMLHAFDAADGRELFAYLPQALLPRVSQLTLPEYAHRPYVDGAISVGEARVGGDWKTVLLSGMGGGAQGLFALDVSNPADFGGGAGAILEFTDSDDADMGNLVGAPLVAKFKTKITDGVPEYKYFAVVAGGLNNYRDDGVRKFDAAAPGALFLLSLDKRPSERWHLGVNYYKFKTPISDARMPNGLSSPALVSAGDGSVRYAYAGDLQGNMWRFDFTGAAPWSGALGATPVTPLFTARDADGVPQPITVQPKVVFAPGGGYLVLFGTGKLLEEADTLQANFKAQSFYGIYDVVHDADKVTGRAQLAARMLTKNAARGATEFIVTGDDFAYGAAEEKKRGWYFDFADSGKTGERSVSNPIAAHGRLFFNSVIPGGDPCSNGGGRTYALDLLTGLPVAGNSTGLLSQIGFLNSPLLFDSAALQLSDRNAIGKRTAKQKYIIVNFGSAGVKGVVTSTPDGVAESSLPAGRTSWREVLNWQELRDAAGKR